MRIVIGGGDEIAFRLAEALMDEHQVGLLCPEGARSIRLDRLDVDLAYGPITSTAQLRRVRITEADLFVAASVDDENNLIACVSARHLGARRTICLLYNLDFEAPGEDREVLTESLGIDRVIVPAQQLAEEILRIVMVPGALDVGVFLGGSVHLLQHAVEEGARITRGPLKDLELPVGVVLVLTRRDEEMSIPKGATHLQAGDKVTAMGTKTGVNRLLYEWLRGAEHGPDRRRATIVGGGTVGLAVARGLERARWDVRVVEADRGRCDEISTLLRGLVIHGDGSDLDLLESERIGDDSVLVAVTSNDEKNLLVSLVAKQLGVPRILTRVDQQSNERLFEKVGIDVVLSARGAAMRLVLQTIGHSKADLLAELEHGDAEVIELDVPEEFPPTRVSDIRSDIFAIIGAIRRAGRVIIPGGADIVKAGDRLVVFCAREHEGVLRDFLATRAREEKE